jgi:serine/threonine protein kinase
VRGFAKVYSYGQQENANFMTMELMGPSLADLY